MRADKKTSSGLLASVVAMVLAAFTTQLLAQSSGVETSGERKDLAVGEWSVQVDSVDPGDVSLDPAFRVAIYENLLDELASTKHFKQVFRSGDRNASGLSDLLILKTTVQHYTPGSETRRAVTTVSGATKLNVRSQLCSRKGEVVWERTVNGNVRFFGDNLRATHNLAHKVARLVKQATLPATASSVPKSDD
jgi:hypothetical protein